MRESDLSPDKKIELFWKKTFKAATEEKLNLKDIILPLARIKRLMKVEEGVRIVASEVPIIFSLIAEKFVEELTLRAWINTEENKRRILQMNDISVAVKTSEIYDFLVYIVPRNELSINFPQVSTSVEGLPGSYTKEPIILAKSQITNPNYEYNKSGEFDNSTEYLNDDPNKHEEMEYNM